jgi:hypothetical protein
MLDSQAAQPSSRPFRPKFSIVAAVFLCLLRHPSVFAQVEQETAPRSGVGAGGAHAPGDLTGLLRDSLNRVLFVFTGRPFDSIAELDRAVGDPATLQPSTASKLNALPPWLWLRICGWLAQNATTLEPLASGSSLGPTADPAPSWVIRVGASEAETFATDLGDALLGRFEPEELLDLGVFALSRSGIIQSQSTWDRVKRTISRWDIWLGVAVLAAQAGLDSGVYQFSGRIIRLPSADGNLRLAWYGGVRDFGISLNPQLRGGLSVGNLSYQVSGGVLGRPNAQGDQEFLAVEAALRANWVAELSHPVGWGTSILANARYVAIAGPTGREGLVSDATFYWRRPGLFGQSGPTLMGEVSGTSNFRDSHQGRASVGLESTDQRVTAVVHGSGERNDLTGEAAWRVGLYGTYVDHSRLTQRRERLRLLGSLMESRVAAVQAQGREIEGLRASIGSNFGTASRPLERRSVRFFRQSLQRWQASLAALRETLRELRLGAAQTQVQAAPGGSDLDAWVDPDLVAEAEALLAESQGRVEP